MFKLKGGTHFSFKIVLLYRLNDSITYEYFSRYNATILWLDGKKAYRNYKTTLYETVLFALII